MIRKEYILFTFFSLTPLLYIVSEKYKIYLSFLILLLYTINLKFKLLKLLINEVYTILSIAILFLIQTLYLDTKITVSINHGLGILLMFIPSWMLISNYRIFDKNIILKITRRIFDFVTIFCLISVTSSLFFDYGNSFFISDFSSRNFGFIPDSLMPFIVFISCFYIFNKNYIFFDHIYSILNCCKSSCHTLNFMFTHNFFNYFN